MPRVIKKKRKKKSKDVPTVDFNLPTFSESSLSSEIARKKLGHALSVAGFTGSDYLNAMNRGKLTMNPNTGQYTFSTDVYSE
jgi:hypothetical protein